MKTAISEVPGARRAPVLTERGLATLFAVGLGVVAAWTAVSGTVPSDVRLLPCPIDAVTGVPCPGCGITRASVAVVRGEWASAWALHPFAFGLVPLAVALLLWPRGVRRAWERVPAVIRVVGPALLLAAVLGRWIARLG